MTLATRSLTIERIHQHELVAADIVERHPEFDLEQLERLLGQPIANLHIFFDVKIAKGPRLTALTQVPAHITGTEQTLPEVTRVLVKNGLVPLDHSQQQLLLAGLECAALMMVEELRQAGAKGKGQMAASAAAGVFLLAASLFEPQARLICHKLTISADAEDITTDGLFIVEQSPSLSPH